MSDSKKLKRYVLHVDDDVDDRELMREVMEEQDSTISVYHAENGISALDYLVDAKASGNLPSLIIVDLNMPKMDGKDLVKELKKDEQLSMIPLVIFTTSTSETDRAFAQKYGVKYFTKPTSYKQLSEILRQLLYLLSLGYALLSLHILM